ncbi:MAG: hypothetical protein CMG46_08265 [Candidatus Marinimicrobia bacterium]|nr:hypothetical protein [Candidatus Neomarinimicrobiota bacterium]
MSTVPTLSPALAQLLAQAANAPAVQIVQPPTAISALPAGSIIEAVIMSSQPKVQAAHPTQTPAPSTTTPPINFTPNITMQTGVGIITARTPIQLPEGTRVELEVFRAANNQVSARLISVNNVSIQSARLLTSQNAAPNLQNPALVPQNDVLKAPILPVGQALTPAGPIGLSSLGPISAFVILSSPTTPQTTQSASILGTPTGTVSSLTATGAPVVQINTPQMKGQVQLSVNANMPIGTLVKFEVTTQTSTQTGAISGPPTPPSAIQPNSPPGIQGTRQSALPPISTQATPIGQTNLAPAGQLGAAPSALQQPGSLQSSIPFQLFAGSELTVRLTAVQIKGAQNPQYVTDQFGSLTRQPALASPAQANTTTTALQPPGLTLPGPKGLPPAAPTPPQTVQPASILGTLTGTVSSLSATGAPVVQIDAPQMQGQVQLNLRANIPIGTLVTFEVTAQSPTQTGAASGPPSPFATLPLSGPAGASVGWPTIVEALTLLQRTDPAAAQQLAQSIPDGGARTTVAVLAFVHAVRTGDPRQWPGDANLRAIERTSPRGAHLAAQLSGEVSELAARTRDVGGEWRSIPIPWNAEGRIERINLITQREDAQEKKGGKEKGSKGIRFLINLDLSRLGSMQLDGMFRKEVQTFDMMIRTKKILADNMRRDLTGMFANTNAAMGLKGGLTFQVMRRFPDPVGKENSISQPKPGLWA